MKKRYIKRKYKLQEGISYLDSSTLATPDYQKALDIRETQDKNRGSAAQVGEIAGMFVGLPPGITKGVLKGIDEVSSSLTKDSTGNYKSKEMEVLDTFANPVNTINNAMNLVGRGKEARNQAAANLWSGSLGALGEKKLLGMKNPLGGDKILGMKNPFKKNPFGKTTAEKVKDAAIAEEERVAQENRNKWFTDAPSQTTVQTALAKKGKYKVKTKVKTKVPRLIETEGREPIFSPPDKNGKRKLLYYNPNDPTHAEGGVKAMVMPRAQQGKKNTKPFTWKPPGNVAEFTEAKKMSSSKAASVRQKQGDSLPEDFIELVEPSGTLSYDDVMRSYDRTGLSKETAIEAVGALPFVKYMKLLNGPKLAYKEYLLSKALRYGSKGSAALQAKEMSEEKYNNGVSNLMPKRSKISLLGSGNMAVGAKQLKVNTLNDAAFSSNLTGMPAINAANKFIQPMAGKMQVARQIPEYRRKEKQNTPRSHRKENPDTNRIIDPPMLYEMKPPPPRSTFNTKNDFNKGSKKVKVYR
jgi:predicted RNA-binding protein